MTFFRVKKSYQNSTDVPPSYKGIHKHVKELFKTEEFKKKYPTYT